MRIPIAGQTYTSQSTNANAQRAVNMYPETDPTGKDKVIMYPTPGLTEYTDVGIGPIRGIGKHNGELVVVSNDEVYTIALGGAATKIGTLSTSLGDVYIANFDLKADNETLITDGTKAYHWDGTSLTEPTIPSGVLPEVCVWVDGFFIINDTSNPGRFWVSNSYDGETWSSLAFATAERNSDKLKQIAVNHRDVYLIGETTTEVWYNAGILIGIPFRPKQGQFIEKGTIAPASVAKLDKVVIMLSQDDRGSGQVIAIQGNNHKVVSTRAIENSITSYSTITDATAYTYQDRGHSFYVITFPTANRTWVYDFNENAWHERASSGLATSPGLNSRHRGVNGIWFDNKNIVGDIANGKLYYYDKDNYTDNGEYIRKLRTTQYIHNGNNDLMFHQKLEIEVQAGVGDNTTIDPQVMLRWSDDGRHLYTSIKHRKLGKKGKYAHKVVWRMLSSANSRVYEVSCTDNVYFAIISGYLDAVVSGQL